MKHERNRGAVKYIKAATAPDQALAAAMRGKPVPDVEALLRYYVTSCSENAPDDTKEWRPKFEERLAALTLAAIRCNDCDILNDIKDATMKAHAWLAKEISKAPEEQFQPVDPMRLRILLMKESGERFTKDEWKAKFPGFKGGNEQLYKILRECGVTLKPLPKGRPRKIVTKQRRRAS